MTEIKNNRQRMECERFDGISVMKVIKVKILASMDKDTGKKLIEVYYDLDGNELFRVDPED